jgi:hypothetical protein
MTAMGEEEIQRVVVKKLKGKEPSGKNRHMWDDKFQIYVK